MPLEARLLQELHGDRSLLDICLDIHTDNTGSQPDSRVVEMQDDGRYAWERMKPAKWKHLLRLQNTQP